MLLLWIKCWVCKWISFVRSYAIQFLSWWQSCISLPIGQTLLMLGYVELDPDDSNFSVRFPLENIFHVCYWIQFPLNWVQHESLFCDDFAAFGQYNAFIHKESSWRTCSLWRHIGTASSANILSRYLLSFCSLHYICDSVRQRAISKKHASFQSCLSSACIRFLHAGLLRFEEIDFNPPFPLEKGLTKQVRKITTLRAISIPVSMKMSASDVKLQSYLLLLESKILCFM